MARKSPTRNKHNAEYPYDDLGPLHQPLPMPTGGMPIDKGIERFVRVLRYHGVHTDQSCEGGQGHPSHHPVVRFNGSMGEGLRALGIALDYGFPVLKLRRVYYIDQRGEIVFHKEGNPFVD